MLVPRRFSLIQLKDDVQKLFTGEKELADFFRFVFDDSADSITKRRSKDIMLIPVTVAITDLTFVHNFLLKAMNADRQRDNTTVLIEFPFSEMRDLREAFNCWNRILMQPQGYAILDVFCVLFPQGTEFAEVVKELYESKCYDTCLMSINTMVANMGHTGIVRPGADRPFHFGC